MTNAKSTKRALLTSVVAMILCFTMLLGTTFAWFTDSVSSNGNVIQSGTLDVKLFQHFENTSVEITDSSDPIFGKIDSESANANSADTLWEPGKTQTVYLSIKNNGSLDLKYAVVIEVTDIKNNLNEVLSYYITPDAQYGEVTKDGLLADTNNWALSKRVTDGINFTDSNDVPLASGMEHFFALSVHMDELAGNQYQDGNVVMNIKVLATQYTSEEDSFDDQYDAIATYPYGYVVLPAAEDFPVAGYEIAYTDADGNKTGTITVPAGALPAGAKNLVYTVTPTAANPEVVVEGALASYGFDINVEGLKNGNTTPILAEVRIAKNIEGDVHVYHYNEEVQVESYNPETGMVRFYTTSFSPFTVVVTEKTPAVDSILPGAILQACPEYVNNSSIEWQSYGDWSPTAGLEANLDACYKFIAPDDAESVETSAYKNWWVDFVLELNAPLGADGKTNEIFLGGNYGSWGWVGFHSGDLQLDPNTEVPVLASASGRSDDRESGWTYEDIVKYVGEFTCGVGNVGNSLAGATITVTLRLTNPDNLSEHYDVNTVTYTFPAAN